MLQRSGCASSLFTLCALLGCSVSAATIGDFGAWTLIEDPPHAGMSGLVDSASKVTLTASGPIPSATDIGYASVTGNTVATSKGGFFFSPANDFSIAVDFSLSSTSSAGGGAIGFGIGEEATGQNSAGLVLAFVDGTPTFVTGAARVADASQGTVALGGGTLSGRLFVDYDAGTGNVGLGMSGTPGSASADVSGSLDGIQNLWNDDPLLVSLFLRSQAVPLLVPALTSGSVTAEFSNFTVLSGTAMSVVPLPASVWLLSAALGALVVSRRRLATVPRSAA